MGIIKVGIKILIRTLFNQWRKEKKCGGSEVHISRTTTKGNKYLYGLKDQPKLEVAECIKIKVPAKGLHQRLKKIFLTVFSEGRVNTNPG